MTSGEQQTAIDLTSAQKVTNEEGADEIVCMSSRYNFVCCGLVFLTLGFVKCTEESMTRAPYTLLPFRSYVQYVHDVTM